MPKWKVKTEKPGRGVYTVPAVKKAFMILEMMARDNRGYTISEAARQCSLPVSTANVLIYTLLGCGYVRRSENRTFFLTWKMFREGSGILDQSQVQKLALPELERLAQLTDLTTDAAIPDQYELIYVYVMQGRGAIQIQARVGQHRYFHQSALGKAMLAFFPEERIKDFADVTGLPAVTPRTITTYGALLKEVEQVRHQGYAVDNEESGRSLWGAAAPIFDYSGSVVAALGVAGTIFTLSEDSKGLITEIKTSAQRVSALLGFRGGSAGRTPDTIERVAATAKATRVR